MKRSQQSSLEDKSRSYLKSKLLSKDWIVRDIWERDTGLDMDVEIVEDGKVTNNRFWLQVKATGKKILEKEKIPFQMEAKHMKYYEGCKLPVVIVLGIKQSEENFDFYFLFAQKYIEEVLSTDNPNWRVQKTVTVRFDAKLDDIGGLENFATEGYFYITAKQLNIRPEGAQYWLDGIPKSDDKELKERTLNALLYMRDDKYISAVIEFENILRLCTVSPTEKMAILLNLGNACRALGKIAEALTNYKAIMDLTTKVSEKEAVGGKSAALGNIGLIYSEKGDLDTALKYHEEALKIHRGVGYKKGEANDLGNIGFIYNAKGDLDNALKYLEEGLKIHKEVGYRQGEASDLGNMGLIYRARGDLDSALKYHEEALKIHREVGYRRGEASDLGNIGLIYSEKGDLDSALKYHEEALKIDREGGYRQGEASDLGNIGLIYRARGDLDTALKYLEKALKIHRGVGYRQWEASDLGNIGLIYSGKGDLDTALKYLEEALKIHREVGYKQGEANQLGNIGLIYNAKGDLDNALKYLEEASEILDKFKLIYARATIQSVISSIKKIKHKKS